MLRLSCYFQSPKVRSFVRGCLFLVFLSSALKLSAQDPFEIHIYEYEPMKKGEYSLEAHLNLVTQGSAMRDGTLLPTEHQTHLTLEPTGGLSSNFALGFMFLNAWDPGYSPQFAGWRVLPHFYAPESWNLPARTGFDLGDRGPGVVLKSRFEWHWGSRNP